MIYYALSIIYHLSLIINYFFGVQGVKLWWRAQGGGRAAPGPRPVYHPWVYWFMASLFIIHCKGLSLIIHDSSFIMYYALCISYYYYQSFFRGTGREVEGLRFRGRPRGAGRRGGAKGPRRAAPARVTAARKGARLHRRPRPTC